jgi:hypothetical protein
VFCFPKIIIFYGLVPISILIGANFSPFGWGKPLPVYANGILSSTKGSSVALVTMPSELSRSINNLAHDLKVSVDSFLTETRTPWKNAPLPILDSRWITSVILYLTNAEIKADVTLIAPAQAAITVAQKNTESQKLSDRPHNIILSPLPLWPIILCLVCLWVSVIGFIYFLFQRSNERKRNSP